MKKNGIILSLIIFCVIIITIFIILYLPSYKKVSLQKEQPTISHLQSDFFQELELLWIKGARHQLLLEHKCTKLLFPDIPSARLLSAFNPVWLGCLINIREVSTSKIFTYPFIAFKNSSPLPFEAKQYWNKNKDRYEFKVKIEKYIFKIELKISAKEKYLPRRIYLDENSSRDQKNYWDNLNRDIYIDEYNVSSFDYIYWFNELNEKKMPYPANIFDYWMPVTNVSVENMKKYCLSENKKLLTSALYNAATALPLRLNEMDKKMIVNSFDPWAKYQSLSLLNQPIRELIKNNNLPCDRFMMKECFNHQDYGLSSVSWIGMRQVFGPVAQFLDNVSFPKEKIMPFGNNWSYTPDHTGLFTRVDLEQSDLSLVGFRCYR